MKIMNKYKNRLMLILPLVLFASFSLLISGCDDPIEEWEVDSEDQVITEYVAYHDEFSEFSAILDTTGIRNLLRVRGPFTLLLPTNDAMEAFYASKNVTSYTELDTGYLKRLVFNHLFATIITTGNIQYGALFEKNAIGDYITSEFSGAEIILNKKTKIIKRDEKVSNGYIQVIDKVIDIVVDDIYTTIKNTPGYSIFTQGLEKAGLVDTLQLIEFPYGEYEVRTYYTMLAVPDTVYERFGINDIEDLIDTYSNGGDLTEKDSGFYKYMVYHVLSEAYYLSDFEDVKLYPDISTEGYVSIDAEIDYKINTIDADTAEYSSTFYFELSNIPAKNGAIHGINSVLPPQEVEPETVVWEVTDFFDFRQQPCYHKHYARFYDGQNTFEDLKWEADFLMYYIKDEPQGFDEYHDAINVNGHFWIQLKTPKIMKGKYKLWAFWFSQGTNSSMEWIVDGESKVVTPLSLSSWGGTAVEICDVEFLETKPHIIEVQSVVPGVLWWDRIEFRPVK